MTDPLPAWSDHYATASPWDLPGRPFYDAGDDLPPDEDMYERYGEEAE